VFGGVLGVLDVLCGLFVMWWCESNLGVGCVFGGVLGFAGMLCLVG